MRLFFLMFIISFATLAGVAITAVLAAGMDGTQPIIYAAVAGAVVALPVSWWAARKVRSL